MNKLSKDDTYYKKTMNSYSKDKSTEKKVAVIYEINFRGKTYIGSAFDIKRRKYMHNYKLKKGNHHNAKLQASFDNKIFTDELQFTILEKDIPIDKVYDVEQAYLDELFKNTKPEHIFNISERARHPRVTGWKHTDEWKKKNSERMSGFKHSEYTKAKMSISQKELWSNVEHREKMSDAAKKRPSNRKGVKLSEETKRRISEAKKGKKINYPKTRKNN